MLLVHGENHASGTILLDDCCHTEIIMSQKYLSQMWTWNFLEKGFCIDVVLNFHLLETISIPFPATMDI